MLQHSDSLVVGGTTMLVHIHNGMDVCPSCCPSAKGTIILPEPSSSEPLEVQRRKELNKIKKRYGLRVRTMVLHYLLFWFVFQRLRTPLAKLQVNFQRSTATKPPPGNLNVDMLSQ